MSRQTVATPHLNIKRPQLDLSRMTDPMDALKLLHRQYTEALEDLRRQTEQRLQRLTEQLDQQRGNRGTPTFDAPVNFNGNRAMHVGDPVDDDDGIPAGLALRKPSSGAGYFDTNGLQIRSARATVDDEVVTRGQLREEMQPAADIVNASFVTANAESPLPNERRLQPETNVTTVTDNGAGSTIVVGIATNGVTLAKFVQASAASRLLGRGSASGAGNYQEITIGTNLAISGTALQTSFPANSGWGSITNVTPDKVYDADATSTAELADVLGTLIAALISAGIISA